MLINYDVRKILEGKEHTMFEGNGNYTFKDKKINGLQVNNWRDIYDYLVTQGEKPEIVLYGHKLEPQEIESGYVSYGTLAKCGNLVFSRNPVLTDELYEQGFGYNEEEDEYFDFFQVFIIDEQLKDLIDRDMEDACVTWSDTAGAYIWGITHWGTSWAYVNAFPIEKLF